jgi:nucleoside-diphosphate-sugar epimerase
MPPIAITGATGFIGRHLLAELQRRQLPVRALARRMPPASTDGEMELVEGHLGDAAALRRLVDGAACVVHCAGVVAAADRREFTAVNVDGTARLLEALPRDTRLVHVSSLAAREPQLSAYADSKRLAETLVLQAYPRAPIVRPPAVYGPGDRMTLPVFRQLMRGLLVMPVSAAARFSLLFVADLADLLARLAIGDEVPAGVLEPDDGQPGGYRWRDLADIAAEQRGARVRLVRLPSAILWPLAGSVERLAAWRGQVPPLSRDKLREVAHPDWVARGGVTGWQAGVTFREGFTRTVAWYQCQGWL